MPYQGINVNLDKGLVLGFNNFNLTPGTLSICHNIEYNNNYPSKRKGYLNLNDNFTNVTRLLKYKENLFCIEDGSLNRVLSNGSVVTIYTLTEAIDYTNQNGNLYITTNNGVKKVEAINTTQILEAGIPQPLDLQASLSTLNGFMEPDSQVAYRVVLGRIDANNNKVLSAPSPAFFVVNNMIKDVASTESAGTVIVNDASHSLSVNDTIVVKNAQDASGSSVSGVNGEWIVSSVSPGSFTFVVTGTVTGTLSELDYGTYRDVEIDFNLPDTVSTEWFLHVYRSSESLSDDVIPQEDLQLVLERNITTPETISLSVNLTDNLSNGLKGAFLYTNPSSEGIAQSNYQPPNGKYITSFKNFVFLGNTFYKHRLEVDLVSVLPIGLDDTFTVDGITLTAKNAESSIDLYFELFTSGTVSQNIENTARSICRVINQYSLANIRAFYSSGYNDFPGKIVFEKETYTSTGFTMSSTDFPTAFNPELPITSEQEENVNRLHFSKISEPEAFPLLNFLDVGSKDYKIVGLETTKDSLIIIKEKGLYRLNGDNPSNFILTAIDEELECLSSDSICKNNNRIYFLSQYGFVEVSDTGYRIISEQINRPIDFLIQNLTYIKASADDQQLYFTIENIFDWLEDNYITLVYNTEKGVWSTSNIVFKDALELKNRMYNITIDNTTIRQQRKDEKLTDFSDRKVEFRVVSLVDSKNIIVDDFPIGYEPNNKSAFVYNNNVYRIKEVTDLGGGDFNLELIDDLYSDPDNPIGEGFTLLDSYEPISLILETNPLSAGQLGDFKMFKSLEFNFRSGNVTNFTIKNSNENGYSSDIMEYQDDSASGFGFDVWGGLFGYEPNIKIPFGSGFNNISIERYLTSDIARSTFLKNRIEHEYALEEFPLEMIVYNIRIAGKNNNNRK
jgi:hypothetical protein